MVLELLTLLESIPILVKLDVMLLCIRSAPDMGGVAELF